MAATGMNPPTGKRGAPISKIRVLLVDEDPVDREYNGKILREQGYEVQALGSYGEGSTYFDPEAFDLVVVTQGSPGFQGCVVLERALEIDRGLPALVLAECFDMNCYAEAMQLGAVDYLAEPFMAGELLRSVQIHVRSGTNVLAPFRRKGLRATRRPPEQRTRAEPS